MISAMHSSAAVKVSADEVYPENGLLLPDMLDFIGSLYGFAVKPQVPAQLANQVLPVYLYQSGKAIIGDVTYPITQLAVVTNGEIVTATSTETANLILDDFLSKMDSELGYRFKSSKMKKMYVSNLVAQFDHSIEQPDSPLTKITKLLNARIPRDNLPFELKRLAFGSGDVAAMAMPSLDNLENADFIIERRAASPYSANRYFCSAPVSTTEHLAILAEIEAILR